MGNKKTWTAFTLLCHEVCRIASYWAACDLPSKEAIPEISRCNTDSATICSSIYSTERSLVTVLGDPVCHCDCAGALVPLLNIESNLEKKGVSALSFMHMHIQCSIFQFYSSACVYRSTWCGKTGEVCWGTLPSQWKTLKCKRLLAKSNHSHNE